ncbi:unknown protein [Microcystis aeruginosa NIES-843]|uniref:Uncharacterized protein n=1 Tax=Microcystis aeruginosa (strain NIES-843 / IAM M-2473) TaxID=449447 RepID=B0JNN0_MICAN|nr:unknown protein [Microcystis aeruginosa NIES-843]
MVEQGSSPIVKLIGDNRSITDNNVIDISRENSIPRISHKKYDHQPPKPYKIWVLTG